MHLAALAYVLLKVEPGTSHVQVLCSIADICPQSFSSKQVDYGSYGREGDNTATQNFGGGYSVELYPETLQSCKPLLITNNQYSSQF